MASRYALLDFGTGKRLEQWGSYRLIRPDPTALGSPLHPELWDSADALYRGEKGKGQWEKKQEMPDAWAVEFGDLQLLLKLTPYKHTGVFPEQEQNWRVMKQYCHGSGFVGAQPDKLTMTDWSLKVLNLFAYTGGATMALAKDGHHVTHVDASKPAIAWARQNAALNHIPADRIRWIEDDAALFVARERKRGKTYDAIILDPPAYGHSPSGKAWRGDRDLKPLLEDCAQILSEHPAFLVLNGYATHDTPESFHRLLTGILKQRRPDLAFTINAQELFLQTSDGRTLSTGVTARVRYSP